MIASHLGCPLQPAAPIVTVAAQALPTSTPISRVPPIPPRPTRTRRRPSQSSPPTVAAASSDFYPAAAPLPATFPALIHSPMPAPIPHSIPPPAAAHLSYPPPTSAPTERPTASCTRCHNKNNPQPCLPGKMTCVGCSFRRKSLRQQREEEGLCTTCGRDRGDDGKLTCGECRAKGRVRYAKGKGKGQ
ncbi:hypothetical protein QR685DRAFT_490800 [Neurospora intermedia]|uniref:Uncharacterized protein n=1 Tax=Neurospora intermedia TaxID=5142 RepID=A0ABR3DKE7_NEUIN